MFRKFEELQTLNAVLRYLVEHNVQIGVRVREGIAKGELRWHRPNRATLHNMLKNPIYAGAYARTGVGGWMRASASLAGAAPVE